MPRTLIGLYLNGKHIRTRRYIVNSVCVVESRPGFENAVGGFQNQKLFVFRSFFN